MLLIVLLVVTGLAQTAPGRGLLRSAGFTGPTGSYSELAFGSPADLPHELFPGTALPPLPFMVHNVTGGTRTYHWTVELDGSKNEHGSKSEHRVAEGQATLLDQGSIMITPEGRVTCAGPVRVTVRLDRQYSIGYHATCASGGTGRQA